MSASRNYPHEMLIGINQLKELRSNVSVEIEAEREINKKLTDEITALNERLIKSQNNLNALEESKEAYSKSIEECELVCECLIHFCMFLVHFKGFINTDQHLFFNNRSIR
jgi:hypothetical protein